MTRHVYPRLGRARLAAALLVLAGSLGLTAVACAPGASAGSGGSGPITAEELRESGAVNLHEAVSKLRPRWLRSRGNRSMTGGVPTELHVFFNDSHLGPVDELRDLHPDGISRVEFLGAAQADALPGPQGVHLQGAIMVYTN